MTVEKIKRLKEEFKPHEQVALKAMTVDEVISELSKLSQDKYVIIDFGYKGMFSDFVTDSWRGSYECPAVFETEEPYTVAECVKNLSQTNGKKVTGYKGGDFILSSSYKLFTEVEYSSYSSSGIIEVNEKSDYVLVVTRPDLY